MAGDGKLAWVQRNRGRGTRWLSAGSLIKKLAGKVQLGNVGPASELATSLARIVDEEFRTHCRVASVRAGRLVIHVDKAELVYPMRLRWVDTLQEASLVQGRGHRLHKIVFAYGTAGISIGR